MDSLKDGVAATDPVSLRGPWRYTGMGVTAPLSAAQVAAASYGLTPDNLGRPGSGGGLTQARMWTVGRNATASTMGACVVALAVTPLDVVKVRMQTHVCPVGGAAPCADPQHVTGVRDAMRKIVRSEGPRGLWRGLNATLALSVPTTGLYFTLYQALMAYSSLSVRIPDGFDAAAAGMLARTMTATIASPVELVRVRLQAGSNGTILSILHRAYREEGLRSLWRGLTPTLARDAPFSAIYWGTYETLKNPARSPLPSRMFRNGEPNFVTFLASGVGAGGLAGVLTVPADVIKTRQQAAERGGMSHSSVAEIARSILRDEGAQGFFRGVGPRVVKVAPACAIMMGSYELFKRILGASNE
jgi:solute carrier family 25, member 39/40